MSMNVNQDYSQFYAGTEKLKSYGNSAVKKDTLVKYRFNTTDENGNKIMDKMSREETIQTMKDIRSQYGDDVIVEFSGDGMAALVENKKSSNGAELDKIMAGTPEQRVVPDDMVTQLEGTYRKVSANDEINAHISWHDTLKEKAPDVCDELDDLMQNILDHALNHSGDGEKFGARFVELVKKAEAAISTEERKKTYEDMGIHADKLTVDFSPDSQEFMAQVAERKAAQAAEKARLEAENPWSPFDYRGDLSQNEPT
ncbi:MAG: hypothetical protein NC313_10955 [Butyrivibrio sp.]|nr:hypothetical protein [Butyrivibrio sp.]